MPKSKKTKIETLLITIFLICIFFFLDYYQIRVLKVVTSSMEPEIKKGSLVFIKKDNNFKIGDIASYQTSSGKKILTHRIVKIFKLQDNYYFNFKGDANEAPDPYPVSGSEIIGKYFFSIPFLGDLGNLITNSKFLFVLLSLFSGLMSGKLFKKFVSN